MPNRNHASQAAEQPAGGTSLAFRLARRLFSRENLYALLFCLILIAILILTAGQAPQWIYQGF